MEGEVRSISYMSSSTNNGRADHFIEIIRYFCSVYEGGEDHRHSVSYIINTSFI